MTTTNPRLNVTFQPETVALLASLAKKRGKSISTLTKELVLEALERQEDIALSRLADRSVEEQKGKRHYSHEEAWR